MTMTRSSRIALAPLPDFGEHDSDASISDLASSKARGQFRAFRDYELASRSASAAGFEEWARENLPAIAYMEECALYYASFGRPFSFGLPWELCRYWRGANNKHSPVKLSNNYRSLVTAYVCDRHPNVDALVSHRRLWPDE